MRVMGLLDDEEVMVAYLRAEIDSTIVRTSLSEGDPAWRYTDEAGHAHAPETVDGRVRRYPSLAVVATDTYWCEDCHEPNDVTQQVCMDCGEVISPGSRPARDIVVPGPVIVRAELLGGSWGQEERTLEVSGLTFRGYTTSVHWSGGDLPRMEFEGRQVGEKEVPANH